MFIAMQVTYAIHVLIHIVSEKQEENFYWCLKKKSQNLQEVVTGNAPDWF